MLSRSTRKLAYLSGAAFLFSVGGAGTVLAQSTSGMTTSASTEAADQAVQVEEVVVTGSRIRGVAPTGSSLVSIGREDIQRSGTTTTAELLKQIPQVTAIGFNAEGSTGPAAASNITRASGPNLRGIGPTATLTIIDGRRVVPQGTQGQLVDPSFIPTLALERVEVIADGASAIYGSDAVAGVINLIPRKNFVGQEASARVGFGDGYKEHQLSGLYGFDWSGGHFVAALDYTANDPLAASERSFITDDRRRFGGANGLATNCASPGTATIGGVTYALRDGNGRGILRSGLVAGTSNLCDSATLNLLLPESERTSAYLYADQQFGQNLKAFVQGLYSKRNFQSIRGNPFLNNTTVPVTNPFRPADVLAGTAVQVSYSLLEEVGPGYATGFSETYQTVVGLEASLGEFRLELTAGLGRSEDEENRRTVNNFYLNQALADSNPATALNLFGGPGNNNAETLARVFSGRPVIAGESEMKSVAFGLDGPLFHTPGGEIRIAVGGEYRDESLVSLQKSVSAANGALVASSSANDRSVKALYGELFIPLVGPDNARPGLQRLDLSIAGRWEEYSDFGSTSNPKVGINWRPLDGLTLRSSYGTSFRAPGLSEGDPRSSGAGIYQNTNNILANGTRVHSVTLAGGNPNLKPETATTWSAGFDFEPVAIPRLRFSSTYFSVEYENQIVDGYSRSSLYLNNPGLYANLVGAQGGANFAVLRQMIEQSGFTASPAIDYSAANLVLVDGRRVNVGQVIANGLDFDLSYRHVTDDYGSFSFGANATRFFDYETAENNQAAVDRLNTIAYPAKLTGRGYVGWDMGGLRSRATVNYVNSYINTNSNLVRNVDAYTTVDLDFTYELGEGFGLAQGVRLGLNVRNLTDEAPPLVDMAGSYDPSKASALGRIVALSLSKRW